MKRTIGLMLLAVLAIGGFCSSQATACPHCNIHNYLALSVQSSSEIFCGKVLRQIDEETAEVEVLNVLRGKHKVGSRVKSAMFDSKEDVGKQFIFSNPTSFPLNFEVLPLELEDEVLFLMQPKPAVHDVAEAIKRVQGVSVETQALGMEYLENHYDEAVGPLIVELNKLMPEVFSTYDVFFGEHRLGNLVSAVLARPSDQAKQFSLKYVADLAKGKQEEIDWNAIPQCASSRGIFLCDILGASKKHEALAAALRKRLLEELPSLKGKTLADTVYAMVISGSATADGLQTAMRGDEAADILALGLYFSGNFQSRWWQREKAHEFWSKALAVAKRQELRKAISDRIAKSEQRRNRNKNNANNPPSGNQSK